MKIIASKKKPMQILRAKLKKDVSLSEIQEFLEPKLLDELSKALKKAQKSVVKIDEGSLKWLAQFSKLDKHLNNADATKASQLIGNIAASPVQSKPVTKSDDKDFVKMAAEVLKTAQNTYDDGVNYVKKGFGEFDMVVLSMTDTKMLLTLACHMYAGDAKKAGAAYDALDTAVRDLLPGDVEDFVQVMHFPDINLLKPSTKLAAAIEAAHKAMFGKKGNLYYPSQGDLINDFGFTPEMFKKIDASVLFMSDDMEGESTKRFAKTLQSTVKNMKVSALVMHGYDFIRITKV